MKIFVTGTDTNVGKTVISAWLCYHMKYAYWKPIQTGSIEGADSKFIAQIGIDSIIYPDTYVFKEPCSPHVAASLNKTRIDMANIIIPPNTDNLIIEGAGGVLVPLNQDHFMIDLIKNLNTPVILIARTSLGTINHTLLSIEALKNRHIPILGVIMNNQSERDLSLNAVQSIETYGGVPVLATFPYFDIVTPQIIKQKKLPDELRKILAHD
jgi:dethiobiotin synthetase